MIGANIHALRETGKRSGMALKHGPGSGTSSELGLSMEAETPEDTANRTARNSEGGNGPGSATLLSEPPISNHSRVPGGGAKAAHAEVPCAKSGPVNVPKKTMCTLDKSGGVWSWGAVKRIPRSQNLERRQPEQNNPPNLGPKNVKKLVLPQPPRIIKKARRQRKSPTFRNEDQNQLSIKKFLEATRGVQPQNGSPLERVPTPDKNSSGMGVLKKVTLEY